MLARRKLRLPVTVGLDVHKRETQACVVDAQGRVVEQMRFPTTRPAFRRALTDYKKSAVVIEALGFTRPVARWLAQDGYEVHVAHPRKMVKPSVKTDRVDAKHLADLLRVNLLPESWLAPENVQLLRDLARHRQFLGQQRGRLKAKIKHDLYKHGHFVDENPVNTKAGRAWLREQGILEITSSLNVLESVEDELEDLGERIEAITTDDARARLLMTIPGVGAFTALVIIAEVGDVHRFSEPDKLASYAGFAIRQEQSGDRDWRGRITREGSPLLRWVFIEAARNHVRYCPDSDVSRKFARLAKTKGRQRATVAAARSLIHAVHAMMRTNTAFRVNRPTSDRALRR